MSGATLGVGIVGANAERGWAKDAHVPALAALEGFNLVAVCARMQSHAVAAAKAFGATGAFTDPAKLIADPAVDIVAVTVRVPEHRAVVLAALKAGKHVYCEWPLGRNVEEAEEMELAAARAGSCAMIGLQGLAAPAVRQALALVAEGALGALQVLRVTSPTAGWGPEAPRHYAYLQDKETGATLASIAGGHTLALMEALAGPIMEVEARNTTLRKTVRITSSTETVERTSPDHMMVMACHTTGCVSLLEVIGGARGIPFRLELTGSKGRLIITGRFPGGYQGGELLLETIPSGREPGPAALSAHLAGPPANVAEAYASLARAIRSGVRPQPDFETAARLTRLLEAVDRASDRGQRQTPGV